MAGGRLRERWRGGLCNVTDKAVSGLKSRPSDPRETRRRVEEALRKHDRGEALTETEQTVVYWVRHGGGCHACGSTAGVRVAVKATSGDTSAKRLGERWR